MVSPSKFNYVDSTPNKIDQQMPLTKDLLEKWIKDCTLPDELQIPMLRAGVAFASFAINNRKRAGYAGLKVAGLYYETKGEKEGNPDFNKIDKLLWNNLVEKARKTNVESKRKYLETKAKVGYAEEPVEKTPGYLMRSRAVDAIKASLKTISKEIYPSPETISKETDAGTKESESQVVKYIDEDVIHRQGKTILQVASDSLFRVNFRDYVNGQSEPFSEKTAWLWARSAFAGALIQRLSSLEVMGCIYSIAISEERDEPLQAESEGGGNEGFPGTYFSDLEAKVSDATDRGRRDDGAGGVARSYEAMNAREDIRLWNEGESINDIARKLKMSSERTFVRLVIAFRDSRANWYFTSAEDGSQRSPLDLVSHNDPVTMVQLKDWILEALDQALISDLKQRELAADCVLEEGELTDSFWTKKVQNLSIKPGSVQRQWHRLLRHHVIVRQLRGGNEDIYIVDDFVKSKWNVFETWCPDSLRRCADLQEACAQVLALLVAGYSSIEIEPSVEFGFGLTLSDTDIKDIEQSFNDKAKVLTLHEVEKLTQLDEPKNFMADLLWIDHLMTEMGTKKPTAAWKFSGNNSIRATMLCMPHAACTIFNLDDKEFLSKYFVEVDSAEEARASLLSTCICDNFADLANIQAKRWEFAEYGLNGLNENNTNAIQESWIAELFLQFSDLETRNP